MDFNLGIAALTLFFVIIGTVYTIFYCCSTANALTHLRAFLVKKRKLSEYKAV